jgi:hypothetical protein
VFCRSVKKRAILLMAVVLFLFPGIYIFQLGRTYAEAPQSLDEAVLSSMESTWAPASKPLPLLHLSKVQSVTAIYDHGIILHLYQAPLVRALEKFKMWKSDDDDDTVVVFGSMSSTSDDHRDGHGTFLFGYSYSIHMSLAFYSIHNICRW